LGAEVDVRARAGSSLKWKAWIGLAGGPFAWAAHHQIGSYLNYVDCAVGSAALVMIAGIPALLIAVVSGLLAWSALRHGRAAANSSEVYGTFLPLLGLMSSTLFGLTIALQIGAGAIIPSCAS
jgi:hypothetical protein